MGLGGYIGLLLEKNLETAITFRFLAAMNLLQFYGIEGRMKCEKHMDNDMKAGVR